jgi:hypothetical protein
LKVTRFFYFLTLLVIGGVGAWPSITQAASMFEKLTPKNKIYQQVKHLEVYGLLGKEATKVLNSGQPVSRLQLAFYTVKAKAYLAQPSLLKHSNSTTTFPTQTAPNLIPQGLPMAVATPSMPPPVFPQAATQDIHRLLRELHHEAKYLYDQLNLNQANLKNQTVLVDELNLVNKNLEKQYVKSNKSLGSPQFNSNTTFNYETDTVQPEYSGPLTISNGTSSVAKIPQENTSLWTEETYLGMWTAIGQGSLSVGIDETLFLGNNAPVSFNDPSAALNWMFQGPLGTWEANVFDQVWNPLPDIGIFLRGQSAEVPFRFTDPFNILPFDNSTDSQIWSTYMNSIGYVTPNGYGHSPTDRVFDGFVLNSQSISWAPGLMATFLAGRMLEPNRFEYGMKFERTWFNVLDTYVGGYWLEDSTGIPQTPHMDLRDYAAHATLDLDPLIISLDEAQSHFFTGVNLADPTNVTPLVGNAFLGEINLYPFSFFYQAISPYYSDIQSQVSMTYSNFNGQYNAGSEDDVNINNYGQIAEENTVQNDRKGWRIDFGWNGRKYHWMKKILPSFLDDIVFNVNYAQRTEYLAATDPAGDYMLEPWIFIEPYYTYTEGVWGLDLFGGYATPFPVRAAFNNNIDAARGYTLGFSPDVAYEFRLASQFIPLFDPNGYNPANPAARAQYAQIKTYHYFAITDKWQINRMFQFHTPLDVVITDLDNKVSGQAISSNIPGLSAQSNAVSKQNIPDMFEQKVFDAALMVGHVLPHINVMTHYAWENWDCSYTYPEIHYRTHEFGVGLAYDPPWSGGKIELRFDRVFFRDLDLPENDYTVNQYLAEYAFIF